LNDDFELSAYGLKQTYANASHTSAFGVKADMLQMSADDP
jgi:hypothetical protein